MESEMRINKAQFKEIVSYMKDILFVCNENQRKNIQIFNQMLDSKKCSSLIELGYKVILNSSLGTEMVMRLLKCSRTWALNRMKELAKDPRFVLRYPTHRGKGQECILIFDETKGTEYYIEQIIKLFEEDKRILNFAQIRDGLGLDLVQGLEVVQKIAPKIQRKYPEKFKILDENKLSLE